MASLFADARARQVLSKEVLATLRKQYNWEDAYSDKYIGDLKREKGATVDVFTFPDPTVGEYNVPAGDLSSQVVTYQRLEPAKQTMAIEFDYLAAVAEDRASAKFFSPDGFDALKENITAQFRDIIDRSLAINLANSAGTSSPIAGTGTSSMPIVGHGADDDISPFVLFERLVSVLMSKKIPRRDLHFYIPTWLMAMMRVDLRVSGFGTSDSRRTLAGEEIIRVAGAEIHETINALDGAGTGFDIDGDSNSQNTVILAWRDASSYIPASDDMTMTSYIDGADNALSEDNLMRSRMLWGRKTWRATGIVKQTVQIGSYEP